MIQAQSYLLDETTLLDLTTEFYLFAESVLERHRSEACPDAPHRHGVLPDEVGLAEHVHVVHHEPEYPGGNVNKVFIRHCVSEPKARTREY
jgi:hypothetical protein